MRLPSAFSPHTAEAKRHYAAFCQQAEGLPLFHQPFWLDATCGPDNWHPLHYDGGSGSTQAVMPLTFARRWGVRMLRKPPLTPWLGPFIAYPPGSDARQRFALEQKVYGHFMAQQPKVWHIRHTCAPEVTNVLPFVWQGYAQAVRYTFRLDLEREEADLFARLSPQLRTRIRQNGQKFILHRDFEPVQAMHQALSDTLQREGMKEAMPLPAFEALCRVLDAKGKCVRLSAHRPNDASPLAHLLLCWDNDVAYNLVACHQGGTASDSSVMPFLMWAAIRHAKALGLPTFDFEGSMIPGVARFFSTFGARPVPYIQLERYAHPWLRAAAAWSGRA